MNAHGHTQSYTLAGVYAHTLIYAHTEGPQCSGHLQYWTQTQAWSLYLHVNGLQQSAALFVCSVPPAVWAWGRELLVRWVGGPHQMGSHGYGAKLSEERGKRLPDWQPLKQQGLPHSMEVVHGLVSFYDWRAAERWKDWSERSSCPITNDQDRGLLHLIKSHFYEDFKKKLLGKIWSGFP